MFNDPASIVALIVGALGFSSAILSLIFNARHNRKTFDLQLRADKLNRQKSYNRVMGSLLKLYRSYLKHSTLYSEKGVEYAPDKVLIKLLPSLDNLEQDIHDFKQVTNDESEIIPELTLYIHELLDFLDRFSLVSKNLDETNALFATNVDEVQLGEEMKLVSKRAHSFAYSKILNQYFLELIKLIAENADVKDDFLKEVSNFNTNDMNEENNKIQQEIITRMQESINRQIGGDIDFNELIKSF